MIRNVYVKNDVIGFDPSGQFVGTLEEIPVEGGPPRISVDEDVIDYILYGIYPQFITDSR
jgi:hypothetical protein